MRIEAYLENTWEKTGTVWFPDQLIHYSMLTGTNIQTFRGHSEVWPESILWVNAS